MKEKLEQILNYGKKVLAAGLTLTLVGLNIYCGSDGGKKKTSNQLPVPIISVNPSSGYTPQLATIDISNSYDPDGSITSYKIDYDSLNGVNLNNPDKQGTNLQDIIQHTYITQGTRQVTLEVIDNVGATNTATATINIGSGNPVINPLVYPTTDKETGQTLVYTISSSDPNGTIVEEKFDVQEFRNGAWTTTTSFGNSIDVNLTDAAKLRVVATAKDNEDNSTTYTFPEIIVKMSEQDGQQAILDAINAHGFKSIPTSILEDQIENLAPFGWPSENFPVDVSVKFQAPIEYTWPDLSKASGNLAVIFINYINPASGSDEIDSLSSASLVYDIAVYEAYLENGAYFSKTGVPYLNISSETNGNPTTKADIAGIVDTILTAEDLSINYKPVAEAGPQIFVPKNVDFTIDATNSYDLDLGGTISSYELDLTGDGIYETTNSTGIFNILGYPFDTCLTSTIRVTDDEGAKSTDTTKIEVGSGVCF